MIVDLEYKTLKKRKRFLAGLKMPAPFFRETTTTIIFEKII